MSDNLNVVPQETIVDSPSDYEATTDEPETVEAEATEEEEGGGEFDEVESLDEPETEEDEGEETEEDESEEAEEAEMLEFDFGGNKLEIPKDKIPEELAGKIDEFSKNLWSDYTKRSQANAEIQKDLKARTEALNKIETLGGEALDAFTKGKTIKAELEQLNAVNMQALWQSNPDRARQLTDLKAQKSAELGQIIQAVDTYEANLEHARQEEMSRLSKVGEEALNRKYKGFSTEIAPKLEQYAQEKYGLSADEAAQWRVNPQMTEMAYKAMLYDQMQQTKRPNPKSKPAKPVRAMKNTGKARGSSDPNNMSFGELGKLLGIK